MTDPCPPKRILSVIDSLAGGGAQRHLLTLCQGLNRGSYASDIFALTDRGDIYSKEFTAAGCRVTFGSSLQANLPLIAFRLANTVRRGRYSILHTYLPASFLLGALLGPSARAAHKITTVCARRSQIHSPILSFHNYKRFQPSYDRYITSWPGELAQIGIPESQITRSNFAVDFLKPDALSRTETPPFPGMDFQGAYPILLSIGRLHPDKGHEFAIQAVPVVREVFPQVRLILLGEGPDEQRLRKLARNLNVDDVVIFAGFRKDLGNFLTMANVFLNLAVNEGLNLSTLQAMACGLPTITFHTGQTEYEGEGFVDAVTQVPAKDAPRVAQAILALTRDDEARKQLGARGAVFAQQYDKAGVIKKYEEIYAQYLSQ